MDSSEVAPGSRSSPLGAVGRSCDLHGWSRLEATGRQALVLGVDALMPPETFTRAVTALLTPESHGMLMVHDRARNSAHPTDPLFERQLAAYREL